MANTKIKVKDCVNTKESAVITIRPDETVLNAIQKLALNNIGALPVCDAKGMLQGIVSERDLLETCAEDSRHISSIKVKNVMTKDVITCTPEDDLFNITGVLTEKGIRHIPILDGHETVGIVSMRDIVALQLEDSEATVRFLNDYISGMPVS